jgi:hypothetical protein
MPPRNSVGFCGGGQGLRWAVEPRKERSTVRILKSRKPILVRHVARMGGNYDCIQNLAGKPLGNGDLDDRRGMGGYH